MLTNSQGFKRFFELYFEPVYRFVRKYTEEDAIARDITQDTFIRLYERRRDFIYEAVNQIPGCSCQKPDSAFYMFVNIKKTGMTSDEFCKYILKECYVTKTPGTAFGNSGEGYVRISYANSREKLREAARRMMEVLEKVMK